MFLACCVRKAEDSNPLLFPPWLDDVDDVACGVKMLSDAKPSDHHYLKCKSRSLDPNWEGGTARWSVPLHEHDVFGLVGRRDMSGKQPLTTAVHSSPLSMISTRPRPSK
jgi:hypothetical protein